MDACDYFALLQFCGFLLSSGNETYIFADNIGQQIHWLGPTTEVGETIVN